MNRPDLLAAAISARKDLNQFLIAALESAMKTGKYLLIRYKERTSDLKIDLKAHNDYVTEADRTSEKIIIDGILEKFPDHSFLAEESGASQKEYPFRWIIDPLDGTTNFINGFPIWAVSIALEIEGEISVGVVYDPLRSEIFYGVKGGGAFMNGNKIKISSKTDFSRALLLTGFPFKAQQNLDVYLESFKALFNKCSGIRRAGSASLDLSWLAAGRADGFWELSLGPWDMAAGSLLIKEAGGVVTDIHGDFQKYMLTGNIIAGNAAVHKEILLVTGSILKDLP